MCRTYVLSYTPHTVHTLPVHITAWQYSILKSSSNIWFTWHQWPTINPFVTFRPRRFLSVTKLFAIYDIQTLQLHNHTKLICNWRRPSWSKCLTSIYPKISAQISIAHLCQPNAANANYTASWDDTGRPWAAHSMTLYWWRKASLLLWTFLLSSNTECILIFVERIFRECPVSEDFHIYIFRRRTLSKDLWPMWVTTVAITQHGHSHLFAQECCYHCPARSRPLQRGPLLQLPERESDHTAHEEERCTYTHNTCALQWCQQEPIDNADGLANYNYIHT